MISGLGEWYGPRKEVLAWIAAGWSSYFVVFGLCWVFVPRMGALEVPSERLLLAVELCAFPGLVMLGVLQMLWRVQEPDPRAENPFAGAESHRFQVNQRVMSNTVEQMCIFLPLFLALAVRMDPGHTWALPVLMGLWTIGRVLFWMGYNIGSLQRAIGMDWTSGAAMTTAVWLGTTLF